MKKHEKTLLKFNFIAKLYYREKEQYKGLTPPKTHEIKGVKTIKLFKSWFRLMKNKNRLLYGVVRFADGETWIWQAPDRVLKSGWQRTRPARF